MPDETGYKTSRSVVTHHLTNEPYNHNHMTDNSDDTYTRTERNYEPNTVQVCFDGGTIDDAIIASRRAARTVFDLSREEAVNLVSNDEEPLSDLARGLRYLAQTFESKYVDDDPIHPDDYAHELDLRNDALAAAWFYEECEMSLREALDFAPLWQQIPEPNHKAMKVTLNPREWMDDLDQARVMKELSGDKLYWVIPEEEEMDRHSSDAFHWVNDWGDVTPDWCYDWISPDRWDFPTWIHPEEEITRLRYNESWREHSHTLVYVDGTGEKHTFRYLDDVVDAYPDDTTMSPEDDEFIDNVVPLLQGSRSYRIDGWRSGHTGPSETTTMSRVKSGWHSSMERSSQSERINEITAGKCHEELDWDFPVAVIFSKTSNVCSIGLDIYAPEKAHTYIEQHFDGTAAQPYYAGV